ncbi:MAG: hypothetical protein JNK60_06280, partial [Acidobacteria bacterium]|nr:hypothetical protein [Acidobacteriota bacterium]
GRPRNSVVLVFGDAVYVPPGREADFLAPLPLERLAPELRLAATLSRWGLHAIGDLARLPESDVAARLGEAGAALHAKACGADPEPFLAHVPPSAFTEGLGFDWPVTELSSFMAFARAALERLLERLAVQGLGATRLDLELRLDPDGTDARTLTLPAPTREAKTLLTLLSLHLEKSPPRAPLLGFSLTAHPDRPRRGQLTLFGPPEISPDALATLLARLTALLGEGLAGTPVTTDGHRPERLATTAYAPPPAPPRRREPRRAFGLLSVRVLRPALGLDVDEGEARQARRPSFVRPLAAEGPLRPGRVRVASGPWRLEESWWAESPADRMDRSYWDIELENGGLYRIFQEGSSGSWYADGIYD